MRQLDLGEMRMRPIERGEVPTDTKCQPKQYRRYDQAKPDLIKRMGEYCSFCERFIPTSLAVEHIQSKHYQPQLERSWDNFLLGCSNCNSTKGSQVQDDVTQSNYYWPHLDNTFRAFVYKPGGIIDLNPALNADERDKALRTLELTGLNKHPNAFVKPTPKDKRWNHRREAWDLAQQAKMLLATSNNSPSMREFIVTQAKRNGFWSIWITVFQNDPNMLKQLIQVFPGTCHHCFDSNGKPTPRCGGEL